MRVRFSHLASLLLPVTLSLASSVAHADVRAFATLGYDSLTTKAQEGATEDPKYTGLTYGALAQYDVVNPIPGLGVFVGGGLHLQSLTYEIKEVKSTWSAQMVTGEAGVNFGLIPLLTVQGALGYDYGIGGTFKTEAPGLQFKDIDQDSYTRTRLSGRALLSALPLVRVGAEVSLYPSGSVKGKVDNAKSTDLSGWGINLVAGVSL